MLNQTNLSGMADEELLAAILEKPVVQALMAQYGSVQQMLWQASKQELENIKGIGTAKGRKIQCLAEIAKRVYRVNNALPPVIKTPGDAVKRMEDMQFLAVEQFRVIYLNTKNGIIAEEVVAQGTINSFAERCDYWLLPSFSFIIIKAVMLSQVKKILILLENWSKAGKLLDINILDHIIIGRGKFESLKEKGIL